MHELISVVAFFSGVPLFIIGWVMSVVAALILVTAYYVPEQETVYYVPGQE